jgi:hypothetical protein
MDTTQPYCQAPRAKPLARSAAKCHSLSMNSKLFPDSSAKIFRDGSRNSPPKADIRAVIEKAFDYRGDVTITRKERQQGPKLPGYLFDRRIGKTLELRHCA